MIEVFLEPQSYPYSHRQEMVRYLYVFLIKKGFYFRCLRNLLETRVPAPASEEDHTDSPLASSLLKYISQPFSHGFEENDLYMALAREVFNSPLSPHMCYLVLPHLVLFELNLSSLVTAILRGVANGGVASSLGLLYFLLKLVHVQLGSKVISHQSLTEYLELVALLLGNTNISQVRSHDQDDYYDDDDDDDIEAIDDGDLDPLASREELYAICMVTITGGEVPSRLRKER